MTRPSSAAPAALAARRMGRRTLLGLGTGVALVAAASACSPDPTIRGSHVGAQPPTPSATPSPAQLALADQEEALAALLSATAARTSDTPTSQKAWLAAAAAQCLAHAERLRQVDPLGVPASSASASASPTSGTNAGTPPASWVAAQKTITQRADQLAGAHRGAATAATDGSLALFHASASVAAHGIRQPGLAPVVAPVRPAAVEVGTLDDARLVLLSQLRALVQGLEVGTGRLPLPDEHYSPALARITQVLAERDQVIAALEAAKVEIPAAELSYTMPGGFGSVGAILTTWGRLETSVMDGWGRVAAAATGADRTTAIDQMVRHADQSRARGVALDWWPGWA